MEKNRLKKYSGTFTHFYKTVLRNTFKEDGFIINQFRRIPTPKKPPDTVIEKLGNFYL